MQKSDQIEEIFKEIERYDALLAQYEEKEDPITATQQRWKPISSEVIKKKKEIEEMKHNIHLHLQSLIELLDHFIKGEKVKCVKCRKNIPLNRLLSNPEVNKCLTCQLQPIKIIA